MGIFRYPGGKSKLLEPIKEHLYPVVQRTGAFFETFVGGGSVLCQVANDFPDIRLHVNDKDLSIYSFWKLLQDNDQKEIDAFYELLNIPVNVEFFKYVRGKGLPPTLAGRAYHAILFNRTTFSGIATSGPIGGYEQKSKWNIVCRYNPKRIIKEFEILRTLFKDRLTVSNSDCIKFVESNPEGAMYLDPPYYAKGKELYPVFMEHAEHKALADSLKRRKDWVLSYDMAPEIESLYSWANLVPLDARYSIRDKKVNWTAKQEFIILPRTA